MTDKGRMTALHGCLLETKMRRRRPLWLLFGICLHSALGCDGPTEPELCGATSPPGFQAVVGEEVVFQWADCRLTGLIVYGGAFPLWGIEGRFESPVTFGTTPAGASSLGYGGQLEPGQSYSVLMNAGSWTGWYEFNR
jgi:hypothetical protein